MGVSERRMAEGTGTDCVDALGLDQLAEAGPEELAVDEKVKLLGLVGLDLCASGGSPRITITKSEGNARAWCMDIWPGAVRVASPLTRGSSSGRRWQLRQGDAQDGSKAVAKEDAADLQQRIDHLTQVDPPQLDWNRDRHIGRCKPEHDGGRMSVTVAMAHARRMAA